MTNISDTPKLAYSIREACEASGLGRTTIYRQIKGGRLQVVHVGARTVIPAHSLHALLGSPNDAVRTSD